MPVIDSVYVEFDLSYCKCTFFLISSIKTAAWLNGMVVAGEVGENYLRCAG
jgi:hypothetical protein